MSAPSAPSTPEVVPSPMPTVGEVLDLTHRLSQLARIYSESVEQPMPDADLLNMWDDRRKKLCRYLLLDLRGRFTLKAKLSPRTIGFYSETLALLHT